MSAVTSSRPKAPPLSALNRSQVDWIFGSYLLMLGSLTGGTIFLGQLNGQVMAELNLSNGEFGLIFTLATLGAAVLIMAMGSMLDRVAARRLAIAFTALQGVLCISYGAATTVLWLAMTVVGLRLFGQGMMTQLAITVTARWFGPFRGRALAFVQFGYSTGEATFPFLIALGIGAFGWRAIPIIAGVVTLVLVTPLLAWCFRNAPDQERLQQPGAAAPQMVLTGQQWTRGRVMRHPVFLILIAASLGLPLFFTVMIFFQADLLATKDWNLYYYTGMFPVMTVSGIVTTIFVGQLVDRFGAWQLLPLTLLPMIVASLLFAYADHPAWVPVIFLACGWLMGGNAPIAGAVWAELFGTAHIGAIRSMVQAAQAVGVAIGPGLSGWLLDLGVSIPAQAPWFAAACVAMTVVLVLLRPRLARLAALKGEPEPQAVPA